MIRITIEIDGKETSVPASQPTGGAEVPSSDLFVGEASLGAIDAGSAPAFETAVSALGVSAAAGDGGAIDAGAARGQAAANEDTEPPKRQTRKK